jgi:hypothetical protein
MKDIKHINFKFPIILLKILDDDKLIVVDNKTTVRYLNKENLKVLSGFKGNIEHDRIKQRVVAFTTTGSHFSSLSADCKEARLFNAITKKTIAKMTRHQGEVSTVTIDPLNRYMFSGGEDGKTFAVDLKTGKLAFTLPHHADTINEIAFSNNGNWCVTVSYDRKVGVFNIATMTPKQKLKVHASPVMKAIFITPGKFLTIDKNSTAIVWDTYSCKILARLSGVHDDVREVTVSSDGRFLFMGTELGHIIVYDVENYTQIARSYLKYSSPVSALEFDDKNNHLIIGIESGDIYFYDIYEGQAALKPLLQDKKYDEIYKASDANPFLVYTQPYKLVDSLWEKTLEKVKLLLEKGDKTKAEALLKSFKNIPSKNTLIQRLINEYKDLDKFTNLVKQGKYPLAYSMVGSNPVLKETNVYRAMEKRWQKTFVEAQKLSLTPNGGMERAKDLLSPYRGISEKTKHIQELLTEGKAYKLFKKYIAKKDFKMVFEMMKHYPFLNEFPERELVENYGVSLYVKAQKLIKADNTTEALQLLRILIDFKDFAEEAEELRNDIENSMLFNEAIENNDMVTAYRLLDNTDSLQETEKGKELFEKWSLSLEKANESAAVGEVSGVQEALKEYMDISSKHMSIGSVIAWSYISQLERAVKQKKDQAYIEKGVKNYILHFGLRDEIESFYNIFKMYYRDSKLNLEMLHKGSMKMWKPSMIVDSILDED